MLLLPNEKVWILIGAHKKSLAKWHVFMLFPNAIRKYSLILNEKNRMVKITSLQMENLNFSSF